MLVLCVVSILIGACQYSPGIEDRTLEYNRAIAGSTNALFLLNALRASDREPTYYTRNQSNTATGTVTPTISSTFPWGSTPTLTKTIAVSSGAVGATTGFTTVNTVARALARSALTLTPSLTETSQNQLTLANLDDQPSMNGLLSPVSTQIMFEFGREGYNLEELLLLFISGIDIPVSTLQNIPYALKLHCKQNPNYYCDYFASLEEKQPHSNACFYGKTTTALVDLVDAADIETRILRARKSDQAPNVWLRNDPALDENLNGTVEHDTKTFTCFHIVLRALLALDLKQTSSKSHEALYRLPAEWLKSNPRYFADLTQQGLEVASAPSGKRTPDEIGVCKSADTFSFAIGSENNVRAALGLFKVDKYGHPEDSTEYKPNACASASTISKEPQIEIEAGISTPGNKKSKSGQVDCASKVACWGFTDDGASEPAKIILEPRSLEGMVYFIGQIIRRTRLKESGRDPALRDLPGVLFLNPADTPTYAPYEEELFRVDTKAPISGSIVSVEYKDNTYYIPDLCEPSKDSQTVKIQPIEALCQQELPYHASPQILTVLNQIWGLNKSAATLPVAPTVTVITPP